MKHAFAPQPPRGEISFFVAKQTMTAVGYLDRLLDPMTEAFTPELARKLVALKIDPELEQHIETLRRKANEGSLTPEDTDYKEFVEAIDMISVVQAKSRRLLAQHRQ